MRSDTASEGIGGSKLGSFQIHFCNDGQGGVGAGSDHWREPELDRD